MSATDYSIWGWCRECYCDLPDGGELCDGHSMIASREAESASLTDAAKALLAKLPRRVPCYRADYRVALALADLGMVTVTKPERRGNVDSYLVAAV